MVISFLFGRAGSKSIENKNTRRVLGRPLAEYPLIACRESQCIDTMYVSTDDPEIVRIAKKYGAAHIARPEAERTSIAAPMILC